MNYSGSSGTARDSNTESGYDERGGILHQPTLEFTAHLSLPDPSKPSDHRPDSFEEYAAIRKQFNSQGSLVPSEGQNSIFTPRTWFAGRTPGPTSGIIDTCSIPTSVPARDHRKWHVVHPTNHTSFVAVGKDDRGQLTGTFDIQVKEIERKHLPTPQDAWVRLTEVPTSIWLQRSTSVLKQYVENAFAPSEQLMQDATIWGTRSANLRYKLSTRMKTLILVAYEEYVTDHIHRINGMPAAYWGDLGAEGNSGGLTARAGCR
ncbi:hypothetical protein QFC20_005851 [Naganishia adeliensis]|uniref:Uncharacterized protein n=1 Tax=Naganishia adeliensis TaxID=92952 RepID=A0ACC2VHH1_9TREE|nr:hypothetical protein QFC20_005851 [Naganishia adeliensis]